MIKGIAASCLVIILTLSAANSFAHGDEIIYPTANAELTLLQGNSGSTPGYLPERIYVAALFVIIAVGGTCLFLYRKGKFPLTSRRNEECLKLCETRMLGNKQFLVVVEYESQKMLLGVGPGTIRHLCYLGSHGVEEVLFSKSMENNEDA